MTLRILILALLILTLPAEAQKRKSRTVDKVKKEQTATQRQISETSTRLTTNGAELNRQLNRLTELNADMEHTRANADRLRQHIDSIGSQITATADSITILEHDLDGLRRSYAEAMRRLQPTARQLDAISFIFSAKSFAEGWARVRYLRRFSAWRKHKAEEINTAIDRIAERRQHLTGLRHAQDKAYRAAEQERQTLARQQQESEKMVKDLRKEDAALRARLAQQKKDARALDNELNRLIAAEQERIRREEEARKKKEKEARNKPRQQPRKPQSPQSPQQPQQPEQSKPAQPPQSPSDFASAKGKLLYPLTGSHKVIRPFGRHPHPTLKHVETDNAGIDILTSGGAGVRAVYEGVVSGIFKQPGFNSIVMLRHGNYITVYGGLGSVAVKMGQNVSAGTSLGTLAPDPEYDGSSVLHFEIRNEKSKLNPAAWLR